MEAANIKNLAAKTGKSLSEWLRLLAESKLTEKKELKAFLKGAHGVGSATGGRDALLSCKRAPMGPRGAARSAGRG